MTLYRRAAADDTAYLAKSPISLQSCRQATRVRDLIRGVVQAGLASLLCVTAAIAQDSPNVQQPRESTRAAKQTWKPLFDGKTLKNWKITQFGGQGNVVVRDGAIEMGMGSPLTGITFTEKMPKCNYEVLIEAQRIDGIDFFSTVTFPVNDSFCSLVVGGWAGAVVGISCVDQADASENETTTYQKFDSKKWYRIRVQVGKDRIRAWIDDKQVVDLDIRRRRLSTRVEVSLSEPFGVACWETSTGIRKIELRELLLESPKK